jgi:hypothetical protein
MVQLCFPRSDVRSLSVRDRLQGMSSEHSGSGRNHARLLDYRELPTLWRAAPLFVGRHIPGKTVARLLGGGSSDGRREMGEMKREITREEQERRSQDRFVSTNVIAAAIIAAVRLARDDVSSTSPRLQATVADSVTLARTILKRALELEQYLRARLGPRRSATSEVRWGDSTPLDR